MRKRVVGFFAALLLCLGALPGVALAEDYNLWVNGVQVTTENESDVLGAEDEGATVAYDAASNTLTLDGAVLNKANSLSASEDGPTGVIYAKGAGTLTIDVKGDSKISAEGNRTNGIYLGTAATSETLYPQYSLVLTGSAKLDIDVTGSGNAVSATTDITVKQLTLKADVTDGESGGNVFFAGGKTAIEDNADLELYAANSSAIYGGAGVEISGGTVTAEAPKSNPIYSSGGDVAITGTANLTATGYYGIVGNNVTVSDSATVDTTSTADCGIYTSGTLVISDNADVTAKGYYAALRGDTGVDITGGTVDASSVDDCGIYSSSGDISVTGGTLIATSVNNTGIYPYSGDVIISGTADVTAVSTNEWAIYSTAGLSVSGTAKLTAKTSANDPDHGYGAVRANEIGISDNANVDVRAGMYQAIVAYDGISISGGTVYAEAEDTAIWGNSCDVSITGGTVTAVSSDSSAISAQKSLTISGEGTVVDAASDASGYSAICSTNTLEITGGAQVTAIGSKSSGIDGYGDIVISGANTSVTATNGAIDGAAIIGRGNIEISNGADVDASGSGSGIYTTSIDPSDTVEITGSTVQVRLDDPSAQYGIYAESEVSISSSWVDATEQNSDITAGDSVLFTGITGTVYGDASVPGDVEIPEGKTLNVPASAKLTVPEGTTLTNKGTLAVASEGSVTNEGTIVGNIQNAGTVTNEGIIQGSVTGEGETTNNGGISQGGDSLQVTSRDALQKMIGASVGKAEAMRITLTGNIDGGLSIPVGANVVIDGARSYTINGSITCTTSENASDVTNLTLQNLTLDGEGSASEYGIISQNQTNTTVSGLNLALENCTVQHYEKKGIYLTNAVSLDVDGCTFANNAAAEMNDPNTFGDYTIDLNLMNVEAGDLSITNSTFSGVCGDKAVIKVSARGGASDTWQGQDIPEKTQTSVGSLTISGCTFNDSPAAAADVNIGTDSKADKENIDGTFETNSTGNFAVTISNNKTDISVFEANKTYKTSDGKNCLASGEGTIEAENLTVPAGRTASKSADGELAVQPQPTPGPKTHSVTVAEAENGKVAVDPTAAAEGEKVTVTATPAEGHEVASVSVTCGDEQVDVTDNGDGTYSFEMPAGDVTVTVAFEASSPELPFTDVAEGDWYHGAVSFVYAKGLMTGYEGTTLFGPEDALGREQAAAVLHRALGAGEHAGDCGLADVVQSEWYAQAVNWAVETGLMAGYGDGSGLFGVGDALTRDQFAAIVARVAKADLSEADPSVLDGFSDGGEVAGWAVPAVSWAAQAGILEGSDDGEGGMELRPSVEITRGEMATMIQRAAEAGLLPTA